MAQILIRNLDASVVEKLKKRAATAGRSLEAEVRLVLTRSVGFDIDGLRKWREEVFGDKTFDAEELNELIRQGREEH